MKYKGLTDKQLEVLTSIAFGGTGSFCHPKTLEVLERQGLIESYEKAIYGKGNTPIDRLPVMIKEYSMPISEHIKFCIWCSDNC